ncbi:MAG: hypothetical protein LIP28_04590, partial [Deltaproteobacteria bacterium]|nr:hypothetical protein [Deltaproteobacteria bacterium]
MTKPIDGTLPTAHEPEEKNGTRDISRQAAMDVTRETPQEGSVASGPEADPVAGASGPSVAEASPAQAGEGGSVDFVLAKDPEPIQTAAVPASGGDTRSADDLWAALAKDIPAPSGSEGPGSATAVASPGTLQTDPAVPGPGVKGKKTGKAPKTRAPSPGPFNGKALGPVVPARPMMRDEDGDVVPTPATVASRLFTVLALVPIVLPLVLFLVQVVFTLDTRALWYSDEVRYADAYRNMVDAGDWLVLHLNGALYPDKPPLFFWFLRGLDEAARAVQPFLPFSVTITDNTLFFAGVALSGLLCLLATHALASLVARVDRRTVLAADLVLISGFFFAALNHYLRMDLLFAAFITISHVFLFHAWVRNKAPLLMVLGYLFAGAAVLVKGPLGLAFPLLAGVCFLLWQGRITRFFKPDALFGLIVGVAVPGIWLVLAWMNAGDVFLDNILHKQILARALDTWHHAEPW